MHNLSTELYLWVLIGMRTSGVLLFLPGMPGRPWPPMLRVGLAACLAFLLASTLPPSPLPENVGRMIITIAGEFCLGVAMGFVSRMAFYAIEMAGRIIATEIGMTAAPGVDSPTFDQEPVAGTMQLFSQTLFFVFGGHLWILAALAQSFTRSPAGSPALASNATEVVLHLTAMVLDGGVRLAAPFIVLNILVNLAFGLLGKVAPRINVFVLSFSVVNLAGLFLLSTAGVLIGHYLLTEFLAIPGNIGDLLPSLP